MSEAMDAQAALRLISEHRGDAVVLTTMSSSRGWAAVSTRPELDLPMGGAMGKLSSVALGVAMARPDRKVIALDGDGSLLMNLGSLVTIGGVAPQNLVEIVCQNSVYEVTGGQPIPNAERVDFAAMALGAGFARADVFWEERALRAALPRLLGQDGPTMIVLKVKPFTWAEWGAGRRTTAEAVAGLTAALAG